MLAVRDQENLVARHQTGAVLKQQQNGQLGSRYPKTPIKIPLNDENAGHLKGGAKSILTNRTRGNENATTSKGTKGMDKANFVTPMQPRARAVLGDKTTNAKAGGAANMNVKSVAKEIEKSQVKAPTTVRPKQKQPQVEVQKLQVHAEEEDPLSEEEPEYCPPKAKDLPYESDIFPDGGLTFNGLKQENLFKGYYQYYFDPVDENGVSKADKELAEKTRKALEDCDKQVKKDIEEFEWSIENEIGATNKTKNVAPASSILKPKSGNTAQGARRPLSTITSKNAASALSMDDATKSWQRKNMKPTSSVLAAKKTTSFVIPGFKSRVRPALPPSVLTKKAPQENRNLEVNSRTTLGYNKGRAAASALATGSTKPTVKSTQGPFKPKAAGLPRSESSSTASSRDSDKTITPGRYANRHASAAAEDAEWKERVPFLSIFNPEDDDDADIFGTSHPLGLDDDEEFEMKLSE
ncbi:hypothetical protein BX600DRAFT_550378 [Xylariales sp. PMI_506]|nr:hypothetical protein BX600DRAFT_550378 [Xylariales sp. PMI_506]